MRLICCLFAMFLFTAMTPASAPERQSDHVTIVSDAIHVDTETACDGCTCGCQEGLPCRCQEQRRDTLEVAKGHGGKLRGLFQRLRPRNLFGRGAGGC